MLKFKTTHLKMELQRKTVNLYFIYTTVFEKLVTVIKFLKVITTKAQNGKKYSSSGMSDSHNYFPGYISAIPRSTTILAQLQTYK